VCSGPPAWKRLISHAFTMDERVSLVNAIFSDHEVEVVKNLSGDDAQTFVDTLYEVRVPDNLVSRVTDFKHPHSAN